MENIQETNEKQGFCWGGFAAGFVGGAILFLLTIYFVKVTMYSLTAA